MTHTEYLCTLAFLFGVAFGGAVSGLIDRVWQSKYE